MRSKLLSEAGRGTFALVFETGEEVAGGLLRFASEQGLAGSHFTGIGALMRVTLGYWDPDAREYRRIAIGEQVEVLSLVGNLALGPEGDPRVHAHIVVGKADGTAHGGHLLDARVRPTLELVIEESPEHLRRTVDPATGLALLRL